ncbi:SDR family NAD(P)-dependent oxidoreductase [Roseiarcus sp.]|uniref:SDR family NAD(P)-dependent oxidoreductase n=1 Tax=Roseiarcus sp. TaxID=1969460 RepID=UPI003F966F09
MKLAGEVAVVTGAGRGIGRAIAQMQAQEGAKVALLARTAAEIGSVADAINAEGGAARAYPLDIVDGEAVAKAFATIERDLGPVSLLTNNAGAFSAYGPIWTVDPEDWRRDIETNTFGTFNCCRAALPRMIARGRGRIIVMTGGGTAVSFPMGSGYATSKAGLLRFAECVADTLVGSGVLVFAMDPGLVRTAMTERQLESESGRKYLTDIPRLFERGLDVPPTLAARLSVEIGAGRFDRLAGRMLMAARGDLDLDEAAVETIVASDLRSLRVNGMPPERPYTP